MRGALVVTAAFLLACTGAVPVVGGNTGNRQACEAYVAHMNTLTPCMGVSYDANNLCAGVHQTDVDMAPYYDCLRQNSACEGTEPVLELDGCEPPTAGAG